MIQRLELLKFMNRVSGGAKRVRNKSISRWDSKIYTFQILATLIPGQGMQPTVIAGSIPSAIRTLLSLTALQLLPYN